MDRPYQVVVKPVGRTPYGLIGWRYEDDAYRPMEISFVAQIMQHWFGPHPPGIRPPAWDRYPDNYTYFDIETSGGNTSLDVITEVGWAVVRKRRVVDCDGVLLNWYGHPLVDWNWLCHRLSGLTEHMAKRGRVCTITPQRLLDEGVPPDDALDGFYQLLLEARQRGELLVGHNAASFDRRICDAAWLRFRHGLQFPWGENAIFDTGLVEKASQQNRLPWIGDSLDKWSQRAAAPPWNVKWSLDEHCVPKYRLAQRYDMRQVQAHAAGGDCVTGHYLFETMRDIGEGVYKDVPL